MKISSMDLPGKLGKLRILDMLLLCNLYKQNEQY